ncbi:MAG TPA: FecR domain-containing protein [Luteolibacter sp.]|nr:FecR domain-containing protein [Luteolibacter sp.]
MNDDLKDLADGYIADQLSDAQMAELENKLRDDEQARLDFLAYLEVHAGLGWHHRGSDGQQIHLRNEPKIHVVDFRRHILPIAAVIALLAVLGFLFLRPASDDTIVVVKASLHGQWADGVEVGTGTKLNAGRWELQSGLVELETGTGTTLLLEGPASIDLNDKLHARLISGILVVRMPKGKSGFVVDMPRMKITDLGTEFGVSVSADGESRVQVYDGKVRAESNGSAKKELGAGETMLCSLDGEMKPAKFNADRFIRTFPPVRPGYQAGGPLYSKSTLGSVDVAPVTRPVTIDGDLSEWNRAGLFRTTCEAPYDAAYFVEGMMMYDADHLYLAAHVGDPEPMKNAARPGFEFAGGSVIVRISADRTLAWPLKGTTADARSKAPSPDSINERISNIIMWHDAGSNEAQLQLTHGFDSRGSKTNPAGWSGTFRKAADGRGYLLEYRIPWALLNCADDPPRAGDHLAGLWMAHWSDAEGRVCRGQLVDVTNHDAARTSNIPPYIFFQNGPCWGKVNYLPMTE